MFKPSVFMIGWEYPPHNSGGLGVACEGLTQALAENNTQVYFTLPYRHPQTLSHLKLIDCYDPAWDVATDQPPFQAYASAKPWTNEADLIDAAELRALPGSELEKRVHDYSRLVTEEATKHNQDFQVIHAHDWMTFEAATKVKQETGKPMIAHIHSTEFDRIPSGFGSPYIHQTEFDGLQAADRIIAVSYYTRRMLIDKYQIDPEKIDVVHNGAPRLTTSVEPGTHHFASKRPVVVFMGRLTLQKGADYFLSLARQVIARQANVLFVVAGHGDMYHRLLLSTAAQGLSASVLFSGFLRGQQRERLLDRADVFVMPSLSEPFGLVAVEAAQRHTPVIVSKTSGVSEVLSSAIVVDFWDVDKTADKVVELLKNPRVATTMVTNQLHDLESITWDRAAGKISNIYGKALKNYKPKNQ